MGARRLSPRVIALRTSWRALRRVEQAIARLRKRRTLSGHRDWSAARRARTHHLIELGGLVVKAGLVELVADDRATLLGAFLELAEQLREGSDDGTGPANLTVRWRRRGLRAFDADRAVSAPVLPPPASQGSAP